MSFSPKGASLPAKFKKSNNNPNFKQRPRDRLCIIDGYDVSQKVILATEIDSGRKIEAKINPDKTIGSSRTATDKWNGNQIDARMEAQLPIGHRVILEACETEKKIKSKDSEVSVMRCNWIASVPSQDPKKSFTGVFTVSTFDDRIVAAQVWDKSAINPGTAEGEAAIDELGAAMDEVVTSYNAEQNPLPYGVQFRTLVATEADKDGKPGYEMVDCSPPFDWIRAEKDGDDVVIKKGHPLDGEHLVGYLNAYMDYVYGSQDQSAEDAEPGLQKRGVVAEGKDMIVEVMPYRAYPTSKLADSMKLDNERAPLYRLANVVTKYGQQDDAGYTGKNWGVDGIVVLTDDQAPKTKGDSWRTRNLVTRLFTNGYSANIHTLVASADGGKVRPNPILDRVKDVPAAPAAGAAASAPAAKPGAGLTPALQPAQTPFEDDESGGDYFTQAVNASVPPAAEAAAPAAAAPAAAEPAAAEPEASKPAASKPAASKFQRRT